ncbi:MAG: hypothetical protein V4534_00250 [Myxococcota bacterium]
MYQLIFALIFSSICLAEPSATDRYLAYTSELLSQNRIGDEHLLAIIAGAEDGQVANPISDRESRVSIASQIASQTYEQLIAQGVVVETVLPWAREHLGLLVKEREEKKDSKKGLVSNWVKSYTRLAINEGQGCELAENGSVHCWGGNYHQQCDVPMDLVQALSVAVGYTFNCAIQANGHVRCWGDKFVKLPNELGVVKALVAGFYHACAVAIDDGVYCWGRDLWGQVEVPGDLGPVLSISAGMKHTCAVKSDNRVRCWGANQEKQIDVPTDLGPVLSVSAGMFHTCVLQTDRSVRCWGNNQDGRRNVPNDLGLVQAIFACLDISCAVKQDGKTQCWGFDYLPKECTELAMGNVE